MVYCSSECGDKILCTARGRFHVFLARLGKTPLSQEELQWLAPNDPDGGVNILELVQQNRVKNKLFLYEQTQLKNDPQFWKGLGRYLGVSHIPNIIYRGAKGKGLIENDICDPYYDYFRSQMMLSSYEMSVWLQNYFLPVARDPNRTDVVVANDNVDLLEQIFETYKLDPCNRLIREPSSGTYVLDPAVLTNSTNNGTTTTTTQSLSLPPEFEDQKKFSFVALDENGRVITKKK